MNIKKYYILFRNNPLLILARSMNEAIEPWSRLNHRPISIQEFESSLIEDPNTSKVLLLTGRTITRHEFENFSKHSHSTVIAEQPKEENVISQLEVIEPSEQVAPDLNIEDFFVS